MERLTAQQASDLALVTSEAERLGVFGRHGIDSQPFAAVEREARVDLLGVGDLRNEKENPRHRPPRIDAPLLRDRIVQTYLFELATHPEKQRKEAELTAMAVHGVTYSAVSRRSRRSAGGRWSSQFSR
jgi:hypothetical protein